MKREIINVNFNTALKKKIPNRTLLTNKVTEVLPIEKDAIYRRLRGEVPFTFAEVALLAQALSISLDELAGIHPDNQKAFSLQVNNFEYPAQTDYLMWENYNRVLDLFSSHPPFIISETWDTIPFPLCYKYPLLTQFYVYKWSYQTHNFVPIKRFEETNIDKKFMQLGNETFQTWVKATETHYILSDSIFSALVKDLKFFYNLRLIQKESLESIYTELSALINYMEECAVLGEYKESGNNLYFYISDLDIQTHYSLLESNNNSYISMLRTLVLTSATTTEKTTYEYMKNWFTSLKRLSTHISVSGEKERIRFFKKQREFIEKLKEYK